MARDPNSNVTSDDVQKVIVNESKKAGVPAFRFDPNTTPEEKAAQAKAAFPPGLKRDKTHGIGIVTDIVSCISRRAYRKLIVYRTLDLINTTFLHLQLPVLSLLLL